MNAISGGRRQPANVQEKQINNTGPMPSALKVNPVKQDHCRGIISRRALQGKKYLFRDIHNFSFSAKIQDGRQKW